MKIICVVAGNDGMEIDMQSFFNNSLYLECSKMLKKERLIGKQICVARMLCEENDSLLWEMLSKEKLAKWLEISEEELEEYIKACEQFDDEANCLQAAKEYAEIVSEYSYLTFQYFFSIYGRTYLRLLLYMDTEKLDVWIKEIENTYIRNIFLKQKGDCICFKVLKEALEYYVDYYVEIYDTLLGKGFDLAVITQMARNTLSEEEARRLMVLRGYRV